MKKLSRLATKPCIGSVLATPAVDPHPSMRDSIWGSWTAGWLSATAFSSSRSALAALLRQTGTARLWLPAYACQVLHEAAGTTRVAWYGVDATLAADVDCLSQGLQTGDAVLLIAYFGRGVGHDVAALARSRPDVLWIEDRAHALEPSSEGWSDVVLYSPRKLVGVADGGVMTANIALPTPAGAPGGYRGEAQLLRWLDPDGVRPQTWFSAFQRQEAAFGIDDAPMSLSTHRALRGISLPSLAAARRRNAAILAERLEGLLLWPETAIDYAPLAVPLRVRRRDALVAYLVTRGIYCARHWATLPAPGSSFPTARRLAGELVSLPCDHRYGADEMELLASMVLSFRPQRA
jgi:hypothetical protein